MILLSALCIVWGGQLNEDWSNFAEKKLIQNGFGSIDRWDLYDQLVLAIAQKQKGEAYDANLLNKDSLDKIFNEFLESGKKGKKDVVLMDKLVDAFNAIGLSDNPAKRQYDEWMALSERQGAEMKQEFAQMHGTTPEGLDKIFAAEYEERYLNHQARK